MSKLDTHTFENSLVESNGSYSESVSTTFVHDCSFRNQPCSSNPIPWLFISPPPVGSGHDRDPWNAIDLIVLSLNQLALVCLFRRVVQLAKVLLLVLSLVQL